MVLTEKTVSAGSGSVSEDGPKTSVIDTVTGGGGVTCGEQMQQQAAKAGKKVRVAAAPTPTDDDLVLEQATDLLWEPDLSPALRAAVYKLLAATPGVIVETGTADSSGRPSVEISRTSTVGKTGVETFENQKTGATLESAWRQASGELDEDQYQSISYTNTVPPSPYGH